MSPFVFSNPLPPSTFEQSVRPWLESVVVATTTRVFNDLIAHQANETRRGERKNAKQIAQIINIPVSRVLDWAKAGKLPSYRPSGTRAYMFIVGDVEDALVPFRRSDGGLKGSRRDMPSPQNRKQKRAA
jgi:hypothetical protein